MELLTQLERGCAALSISLNDKQKSRLMDYLVLLERWNRAFNLTAVRKTEEMITVHLLDSLSVQPYILGSRIADVGSGAGLPGIPLAICNPDVNFTLLDSSEKKVRFIRQAKIELSLNNIQAIACRVEDYVPDELYDQVISRAFASLVDFVNCAGHLCANKGQLLAMKGKYPADEIAELPHGFRLQETCKLLVPGLDAERTLIVIRRIE